MSFTPANLQSTAKTLLDAAALLPGNSLAGITIVMEGSGDLDAAVEPQLRTTGICVVVWFPDFARRSQGGPGASLLQGTLPVWILANPVANAASAGLQRDPLLVVQAVWQALAGRPASKGPYHFEPGQEPLARIADDAGMLLYAMEFEAPVTLTNPQP